MVDENFLIPALLSGIAFKSFMDLIMILGYSGIVPGLYWNQGQKKTQKQFGMEGKWPKVHYKVVRIWMERKFSGN